MSEKENAFDYNFREGEIEFKDVSHSAYYVEDNPDEFNQKEEVDEIVKGNPKGKEKSMFRVREKVLLKNFNLKI